MSRDPISSDELKRQLRANTTSAKREQQATANAFEALLASDASTDARVGALVGRRRFLAVGGLSVATAALIAACADDGAPGVGRIGNAPPTTKLPDAPVTNVTLLRTASSLEHSVITIYNTVIDHAEFLDPAANDLAKRFRDDHMAHAEVFEKLTTAAGGTAWTCGNPRFDQVLIPALLMGLTGGTKSNGEKIAPSDDPKRDVLNIAQAFESLAGATYQGLVPVLTEASLRKEAMIIAAAEARHAAILSIAITGAPAGYFSPDDVVAATGMAPATTVAAKPASGPPPTPIPAVYAVPGQFGNLGVTPVVVGAPNELGTRVTVNLETPSLNSLVYEYMTPAC